MQSACIQFRLNCLSVSESFILTASQRTNMFHKTKGNSSYETVFNVLCRAKVDTSWQAHGEDNSRNRVPLKENRYQQQQMEEKCEKYFTGKTTASGQIENEINLLNSTVNMLLHKPIFYDFSHVTRRPCWWSKQYRPFPTP